MGNSWVSSLISHDMEKCSKTYRMRKFCEIGNHSFSIAWVFSTISHSMHSMGKCSKIYPIISGDICTHTSQKLWVLLFHHILNIWIVDGFSSKSPMLWVRSAKPTYDMITFWKINTHSFPKIWVIAAPSNARSMG